MAKKKVKVKKLTYKEMYDDQKMQNAKLLGENCRLKESMSGLELMLRESAILHVINERLDNLESEMTDKVSQDDLDSSVDDAIDNSSAIDDKIESAVDDAVNDLTISR